MLSLGKSVAARLAACLAASALALAATAFVTHQATRDTGRAATAHTQRAAQDDAALSLTAAAAPAGSCSYQQIASGYEWVCNNVSTIPGTQSPGKGGGGGSQPVCTLTPLSQQQAQYLGLQWPAPAGHTWETITCAGTQPFGGVVLAGGTPAAPALNPLQLVQQAWGQLQFKLSVQTDPPRPPQGKGGLVGLPEWFWVSSGWQTLTTKPVVAGPVWVIATAKPESIVFNPGGGLAPVTCNGPGTAYNPRLSPSAQHTDCSYTYDQPSTGQPGNAYQATLTVLWDVAWRGSGHSHGTVTTDYQVHVPLTLPVASGQALVTGR